MAICYKPHREVLSITETRARIWDISLSGKQDDILADSDLRARVSTMGSIWKTDGNLQEPGSDKHQAKFVLITAAGSSAGPALPTHVHRENRPLQVQHDTLQYLISVVGFCDRSTEQVLHNWLPSQTHRLHYEGDDEKPTHLTLAFRLPRSNTNVMALMRVQFSSRNCVAFLSASSEDDVQDIRSRCILNAHLLKTHPLYLLPFIYDSRYRQWTDWFAHLWMGVAETEARTKLAHPNYTMSELDTNDTDSSARFDILLRKLHSTDTELCHGSTVMAFGLKFGRFCLEVLDEAEERRQALGFRPLPMRFRSDLEERLKSTIVRLETVRDRMSELKSRLVGQTNVSYNLIAQRNSETNFAIAKLQFKDSQTVKVIAVLTILFLPSTFIATLWTTNLIQINGVDQNWVMYTGVTAALTGLVFAGWLVFTKMLHAHHEGQWPV